MPLKFHEWNQSNFSRKFSGVTTAAEFQMKWLEEMSSTSSGNDTTEKHNMIRSPASSLSLLNESRSPSSLKSLSSQPERPSKRKHSESVSSPSTSGLGHLSETSPSKRCKFIKEGIDGRIERSRRGIIHYVLMYVLLDYQKRRGCL